jgi:hypothetical protein
MKLSSAWRALPVLACLAALAAPPSVLAEEDDHARWVSPMLGMFVYTGPVNLDESQKNDIQTGDLYKNWYEVVDLNLGAEVHLDPKGAAFQLGTGAFHAPNLESGVRVPVDATLMVPLGRSVRVGGGVHYSDTATIRSTPGYLGVLELGFGDGPNRRAGLVLRYAEEQAAYAPSTDWVHDSHFTVGVTASF